MKKITVYVHKSEMSGKRDKKIQIWVTENFYALLDDHRRTEGFPSMSQFINKILGEYVFNRQESEKIRKDRGAEGD